MSQRDEFIPVVVRMPRDLHEAIKTRAATEERSMAQAMRWALRLYVLAPPSPDPTGETT